MTTIPQVTEEFFNQLLFYPLCHSSVRSVDMKWNHESKNTTAITVDILMYAAKGMSSVKVTRNNRNKKKEVRQRGFEPRSQPVCLQTFQKSGFLLLARPHTNHCTTGAGSGALCKKMAINKTYCWTDII